MPQAARRWAEARPRPSVTLSVSASVPAEPSASPERLAAVARDGALVARARAGDAAAFDTLVRTYMEQAYRVAYRVVGHREDAEDLVQEAFLAAYQYLDSFEVGRPFGPWLMRIVLNRGANLRRSRARRSTEPETEGVSDAPSALEETERSDLGRVLHEALGTLSERQRMIVTMFDVDGLTSAEIGEMLELAPGTVRWHLHEARRHLRGVLGRFLGGDSTGGFDA
ncbi:MAG TPA: sigma-70 family RNA polymerase sigma factor [Gemmatimonadaceae bacterium]|nr:sigma-70 family RNA polymerase sigma factor [Gemmatimonadaceae bacterium]